MLHDDEVGMVYAAFELFHYTEKATFSFLLTQADQRHYLTNGAISYSSEHSRITTSPFNLISLAS